MLVLIKELRDRSVPIGRIKYILHPLALYPMESGSPCSLANICGKSFGSGTSRAWHDIVVRWCGNVLGFEVQWHFLLQKKVLETLFWTAKLKSSHSPFQALLQTVGRYAPIGWSWYKNKFKQSKNYKQLIIYIIVYRQPYLKKQTEINNKRNFTA